MRQGEKDKGSLAAAAGRHGVLNKKRGGQSAAPMELTGSEEIDSSCPCRGKTRRTRI
jgi:hypothetical protein